MERSIGVKRVAPETIERDLVELLRIRGIRLDREAGRIAPARAVELMARYTGPESTDYKGRKGNYL